MKEKIGMEKLIELLNEYEIWKTKDMVSQNPKRSRREWYRGQLGSIFGTLMNERESRLSIISKSYGFIKWLVENEKIKPLRKFIGWETDEDEPYIQFDLVDQYIAYLSIQDEPINFLISILK